MVIYTDHHFTDETPKVQRAYSVLAHVEPGWELGTGLMVKDMLCVYHITVIPKRVDQQQSDQEGFDCTTVDTKCVISLQTQRELEEFF